MLTKNTRANRQDYKNKRIEKRVHRRKKRELENEKVKEVERDRLTNKSKKFYETVNDMKKSFCPRTTVCRTKEGELITDEGRKIKAVRTF